MSPFQVLHLKALSAGAAVIIVLGLLGQLVFLILAVYVLEFTRNYPDLQSLVTYLSYAVGAAGYFSIMFVAGNVVASLAPTHKRINGVLAAATTTILSLLTSLRDDGLTVMALLFVLSGIAFTLVGVMFWRKSNP